MWIPTRNKAVINSDFIVKFEIEEAFDVNKDTHYDAVVAYLAEYDEDSRELFKGYEIDMDELKKTSSTVELGGLLLWLTRK